MKKRIGAILTATLSLAAFAFALAGCDEAPCKHDFSQQNTADKYLKESANCTTAATYYYSCTACGEAGSEAFFAGEPLGHNYVNGVCTRCHSITSEHEHQYSEQSAKAKFKKDNATCTAAATYYYSCACGEKGSESFSYGSPAGHDYANGVCGVCGEHSYLLSLRDAYGSELEAHAESVGGFPAGPFTFTCAVLGKAETIEATAHYNFSPAIDTNKIVGGIFVQVSGAGNSICMLYGIEFCEDVASDFAVSLIDNPLETFAYERVENKAYIVFEYEAIF